jgi:hypothetical protein
VPYGAPGALHYSGAVQFSNQAQWMQMAPAVADSEKHQHLFGLWNDSGHSTMQPQVRHHQQQVAASSNHQQQHHQQQHQQQLQQHQQQQQQLHDMPPRFGLWGAPQVSLYRTGSFPLLMVAATLAIVSFMSCVLLFSTLGIFPHYFYFAARLALQWQRIYWQPLAAPKLHQLSVFQRKHRPCVFRTRFFGQRTYVCPRFQQRDQRGRRRWHCGEDRQGR